MNYIFGNNALLYSRASRGGTPGSTHSSGGLRPKLCAKKGSSEALPEEPALPPSRWQQLLAFFTRRHGFFFVDCVSVAASSSQVRLASLVAMLTPSGHGIEQPWGEVGLQGGICYLCLPFSPEEAWQACFQCSGLVEICCLLCQESLVWLKAATG